MKYFAKTIFDSVTFNSANASNTSSQFDIGETVALWSHLHATGTSSTTDLSIQLQVSNDPMEKAAIESQWINQDSAASYFQTDFLSKYAVGAQKARMIVSRNSGSAVLNVRVLGKPVQIINGTVSGANTGDVTLADFGSSANSAGASLSGQTITLQPASASQPGGISLTTQTMGAGDKTFPGAITINSAATISGLATIGSSAGLGTGTNSYHLMNGTLVGRTSGPSFTNFTIANISQVEISPNVYRDGSNAAKGISTNVGYTFLDIKRATASGSNIFILEANYQDAQSANVALSLTNDRTIMTVAAAGAITLGPTAGDQVHIFNGTGVNFVGGTASDSLLDIKVTDGNAGDPAVIFRITGIQGWHIGCDNSDSDVLSIGPATTVGTSQCFRISTGQTITLGPTTNDKLLGLNNALAANSSGSLTLTNAPTGKTGNPTGYLNVTINGSSRVIPFW